VFAQGDDPNRDGVPLGMVKYVQYSDSEEDVITVSGYDDFNLGVDYAECHISQNPLNPLQFFGAYNINGAWRTSDGHDWLHSSPSFGVSPNGDPVTAYDGAGHLYYETMFGGVTGCKVIVSTDNGATWSSAVTSISGNDKNWMAADQTTGPYSNYVYTVMTPGNFARTTNFGSTWSTTETFGTQSLPGMMVCVAPNGTTDGGAVFVVTNSGSTFASTYTFYVSTDGGLNFTNKGAQSWAGYVGTNVGGRHTVRNMRTRPYPFIAADQSTGSYRGRLYCVYATNDPVGNGNKPDVWCRYSTNQGTSWSSAIRINDDVNPQNNHQWHPAIWCDTQTGRLYASWMDTRDTPSSDSAYIYASYSDNGGVTWAANQRVSNQKMKIDCTSCGGSAPRYQGDYFSMYSTNNQSIIMWTDFRSGNFGSYAGYFPDYAFLVSPAVVTVISAGDTGYVTLDVPSVKLYTSSVTFSATVTPPPGAGTITLDYPSGNVLPTPPGSRTLRIITFGGVTPGTYTINIQAAGPNGIPVHRRTVQLDVLVPVEMTSFSSFTDKNDVILNWSTATETNNQGFEVQRKRFDEYENIGFVPGSGTSTELRSYTFRDEEVIAGKYYYRLKQIDYDGSFEYSGEIAVEVSAPKDYMLSQNYPNPFNPSTIISYAVAEDVNVSIKVFDVLGNEVALLVNEDKPAGIHSVLFDASNLSSGVYYYTLQAGNFTAARKLMLMK